LLLADMENKNYLKHSGSFLSYKKTFSDYIPVCTAKGAKTFLICDACHSGLISGDEGKIQTAQSFKDVWQNDVKIFSCQPDENSAESVAWGGGRGLFSYFFLLGIEGLADKNKDNIITLGELHSYITDSVTSKSNNEQTPMVIGSEGIYMGAVKKDLVADANNQMFRKSTPDYNALAKRGIRGVGGDKLAELAAINDNFNKALQSGRLLSPQNDCAQYFFNTYPGDSVYSAAKTKMRFLLVNALQQKFNTLVDYVYAERYNEFGINEKIAIEQELNTALQLIPQRSGNLKAALQAKLLFLHACEYSVDLKPGAVSAYSVEQLNKGIDSLTKAIALDPFSPQYYLKAGDYCLYAHQFTQAINYYNKFHQLLPNDEFAWNKLGLAYVAIRDYAQALEAFKHALKINPQYAPAKTNFDITAKKVKPVAG